MGWSSYQSKAERTNKIKVVTIKLKIKTMSIDISFFFYLSGTIAFIIYIIKSFK